MNLIKYRITDTQKMSIAIRKEPKKKSTPKKRNEEKNTQRKIKCVLSFFCSREGNCFD